MTLGQKIKQARKSKKMTQSSLCQNRITRNMLSAIENDKASPSLDTLRFISLSLEVPLSYLLSNDDNIFFYQKAEKINDIKDHLKNERYKKCVNLINSLSDTDDELSYILTYCYFRLGKQATLDGSLVTALKYFDLAKKYSNLTVYNTEREETLSEFYCAVAKNIKAPLLELDQKSFENSLKELCDIDFYKFVSQDKDYDFSSDAFTKHIKAKEMMKNMKIFDALNLLKEIENTKSNRSYNAYAVLSLYADLENCYKQLGDFENAYKYSTKRMTLIEQMKE